MRKGSTHSDEARHKMSMSGKGRVKNESWRMKISTSMKGKRNALGHVKSDDARRRISEANMGNQHASKNLEY